MAHPSWFRDLASRVAKREGKKESVVNVAQASEVLGIVCEEMWESTVSGTGLVGRMVGLGLARLQSKRIASKDLEPLRKAKKGKR